LVGNTPRYLRYLDDYSFVAFNNVWMDTGIAGFAADKLFVVQTLPKVVQRCLLMTTDPGDLVLDPTCGSGTTAYVAEQWGRRWITIDTSRVALTLARSRIMGARYPFYTLADSSEGQKAEAKLTGREPKSDPTYEDIRHGFVYQRVPHVTLKSIANNAEIDTIWEKRQPAVEKALGDLNASLSLSLSLSLWRQFRSLAVLARVRWWTSARRLRRSPFRAAIPRHRTVFSNGRSPARLRTIGLRRPVRH